MPRHVWQEAQRVQELEQEVSIKTETTVVKADILLGAKEVNFGATDLVVVHVTLALSVLMSIGLKKAVLGTRKSRHVRMVGQRRKEDVILRHAGVATLSMPPKNARVAPFVLWHDLTTIPGDSGIVGFSDHKINVMHLGSATQPGKNECLDLVEIFRPYPSLSIVSATQRAESPYTERNLEYDYYTPDDVDQAARRRVQDGYDDCYVFVSDLEDAVVVSIGGHTSRISRNMWDAMTSGGRDCFQMDYNSYEPRGLETESGPAKIPTPKITSVVDVTDEASKEIELTDTDKVFAILQHLAERVSTMESRYNVVSVAQTPSNTDIYVVAPPVGTEPKHKNKRRKGKKECHSPPQEMSGVEKPVPPPRTRGVTAPQASQSQDFHPSV